jgi:clumping factor A
VARQRCHRYQVYRPDGQPLA